MIFRREKTVKLIPQWATPEKNRTPDVEVKHQGKSKSREGPKKAKNPGMVRKTIQPKNWKKIQGGHLSQKGPSQHRRIFLVLLNLTWISFRFLIFLQGNIIGL